MTNKNDTKIMKLKEQINEKKATLSKFTKHSPVTNLMLNFENQNINLNALEKDKATLLLVKLNVLLISAKDLELENETKLSGFLISDWVTDLRGKLKELKNREERIMLDKMEKKLETMLSDEKQVELEIDSIESMLNTI